MKTNSSQNKENSSLFSSLSGGGSPKLTKTEQEVLSLLNEGIISTKQLSLRRQCSMRNIQKIVKNLKKKGAISNTSKTVRFFGLTSEPFSDCPPRFNGIRLHAERWRIQLINKSDQYTTIQNKCNTFTLDGNTIKLYNDSFLVYSNSSFYAVDAEGATVKALEYWNRLFTKLENRLGIIILKNDCFNIKRYRQEYALINNGIAKRCEDLGQKIKIRSPIDNKVRFEVDNSFNLHEAETKHPKTAEPDMKRLEPFIDDMLDNGPYRLSEFEGAISGIIKSHELYAENIKSHVAAINKMAALLEKIESRL